jgi:hypothetical protein
MPAWAGDIGDKMSKEFEKNLIKELRKLNDKLDDLIRLIVKSNLKT